MSSADSSQVHERLERLNAILKAIRHVGQLINREKDEQRLLQQTVEHLIETRKYEAAWIALLKDEKIERTFHTSKEQSYASFFDARQNNKLPTCVQEALRNKCAICLSKQEHPCQDCPVHANFPSGSVVVAQIAHHQVCYGTLITYVASVEIADEEELTLITEIASDIGFALYSLENERRAKQAAEALKEREEKYRSLFQYSNDAIIIFAAEGSIVEVNQQAVEVLGYADESELRALRLVNIHPNLETEFIWQTCDALKKEGQVRLETETCRQDGTLFSSEISANLIILGEKKYVQWILRDISVKKHAEEVLLENAAHYQTLFENSPIPLWEEDCSELVKHFQQLRATGVTDIAAYLNENPEKVFECVQLINVQDMNQAALQLHNAASKETIKHAFSALTTKTSVDGIKAILISIAEKKPLQNFETEIETADGKKKNALISWNTVPGYEETLKRVFLSSIDITPLSQAQSALEEQDRFLNNVFDSIQDGISILDTNLNILRVNKCMEKRHAQHAPIVGKKCYEVYRDRMETCTKCPTIEVIETGQPHSTVMQVPHHRNGKKEISWVDFRVFPIKSTDGTVTGAIEYIRDITLQKHIEKQHRISEERLNLAVLGAGVGLWDWNFKTDEVIINERWANILGYALDEIFSMSNKFRMSLIHPEDRPNVDDILKSHFMARSNQYECEIRMKHKSGLWVWVLERGKVMEWDKKNNPSRMAGTLLDISMRKLTEEALRKNEHFLQTIADSTPSFLYIYDLIERCNYWVNPAHQQTFKKIFKHDTSALNFDDITERIHPDDRKQLFTCFPSLQNKPDGAIYELEYRMIDDDGNYHWFDEKVSVFERNENGEIIKIIGTGIDISARKHAENALQESQEKLLSILHNSPLQIWAFDGQEYRFLSEEWYRYTGQKRTPHPGIDAWLSVVPNEDMSKAGEIWQKAWIEKSAHDNHFRLRNASGQYRSFQCHAVPIFDKAGKFQYFIGYNVDITKRLIAEDALRKFSKVVEQSPSSVIITDLNGDIEYVNPIFTQLTGYSPEEVMGKNPRILKSGELSNEVYKNLWKTVSAGGTWKGEFHNKKKNGELFWEEASICPLFDENGYITHYFSVKQDITNKKKIEDQLRQSQKMEAIGQLAGGVAHDFNNILTVILANSEIGLSRLQDDSAIRDNIQQVKKAANRAAALTRQLLAFSRKQILEPKVLDLNELIGNLQKMLVRLIGEDISLVTQYFPDLKQIKADPGQIEQVIVNLVVNARDAMPAGGSLIIETTDIPADDAFFKQHSSLENGEYVLMTITDTGMGMDKVTLKRIFEPFFTTKVQSKGTGLGLATVYGIIRQSGGAIDVYSEPNMGTAFKVYLPAVNEVCHTEHDVEEEHEDLSGTGTILLVEDESFIREVISKGLTALGYMVFEAANGHEALEISEKYEHPIDLLLTDVVMPKMSGKELSEKITAVRPDIKVIYMSGYTDTAIVNHGVLEEGTLFIQKPFTVPTLAKFIRDVL